MESIQLVILGMGSIQMIFLDTGLMSLVFLNMGSMQQRFLNLSYQIAALLAFHTRFFVSIQFQFLDFGLGDILHSIGYNNNQTDPKSHNLTYAGRVSLTNSTEQNTPAALHPVSPSPPSTIRIGRNIQGQVLNFLIQTPDGCSSLADIHKHLQNEFPTSTELLGWLTGPIGKKICVIQNAITPMKRQ